LERRSFLIATVSTTGALVLGVSCRRAAGTGAGAETGEWVAGPFVRIGGDGQVTVTVARAEMGQGARTALAMLVAEELDADWGRIRVEQGDLDPKYGDQFAGGSAVVRTSWRPLRQAGATARAMLVSAAATRWGVPLTECETRDGRVHHAPTGRSLPYGQLVGAAARLPVPGDVPLKPIDQYRIVGKSRKNVDHPDVVTGRSLFGLDHRVPGMLFAVIERSPVFGGRVRSIADQAARAVSGVVDVIRLDADAVPFFGDNNPKMANGVAVLANSTWAALQGREALRVDWDPRGGEREGTKEMQVEAERLARQPDRFTTHRGAPVEDALRASSRRLDAVYQTPLLAHATMEPMNCLAHVQADRCEVWAPTQMPEYVRTVAQEITGLEPQAITVHFTRMGGAFGRRFYADYAAEAVYLSKAAGRPVQVVWSREDDLRHGFYRPAGYHLLRAGIDQAGRPSAWEHRLFNASRGHYLKWAPPADKNFNPGELSRDDYPVAFGPAFRYGYSPIESKIPRGQWRAVENSSNVFVTQSFVDELAHLAGADPLAYRVRLYQESTDVLDPGRGYEGARLLNVLQLARGRADWDRPLPAGQGRGIAVCYANQSYIAEVVEVTMAGDAVKVDRVVAVVDAGLVVHPEGARAQVEGAITMGLSAALGEEITVTGGRVDQGNFDRYPLLRISQAPRIEVYFVEGGTKPGGLGEPALPPVAAALGNAIFQASGRRIRRLPLSAAGITST
jgi:isoquinoline 1-oxidoreductase subunit beta